MTDFRLAVVAFVLGACAHQTPPATADGSRPESGTPRDALRAREVLEQGAADPAVEVRRQALRYLYTSTTGVEARDWALRGVWDPSPWVQRGTIDVVAQRMPDQDARDLLIGVVGRATLDPYVRCAAAMKLAMVGDTSTLATIAPAWRDESEGWRAAPCALAAATMGDGEATTALGEILRGGELPLDLGFFSDLGSSGLTALSNHLVAADQILDETVHVALVDALVRLDPKAGAEPFRAVLDGPEIARMEGIDFLLDLPPETALPLLAQADSGGSSRVSAYRRLALLAFGQGDPSALGDAMSSADREIRALAMHCAGLALINGRASRGETDDPRLVRAARRALGDGLNDPEDVVRLSAAAAIARAGSAGAVSDLRPLLDDEQTALRVEAAAAILAIHRRAIRGEG